MRILITGGNGYIGSSLRKYFSTFCEVTALTRADFNLSNFNAMQSYLEHRHFDVVIHTAISGGSRLRADTISDFDNNLKMYYALVENSSRFTKFINVGSGAELYATNTLYGLSKHVIRTSVVEKENFYNVRVFGLFDENELDTRFIKANIIKYLNYEPMVIFNDRIMDFFYMGDFFKVMQYYIFGKTTLPKEFDCVYNSSHYLTEIAQMINSLGSHRVDITTVSPEKAPSYTGKYVDIGLSFEGLRAGIQSVYNRLS